MTDDRAGRYGKILEALSTTTASGVATAWIRKGGLESGEWPDISVPSGSVTPPSTGPATPPTYKPKIWRTPDLTVVRGDEVQPDSQSTNVVKPAAPAETEPPLDGAAALLVSELGSAVHELGEVRTDARARAKWAFWGALFFALAASTMLIVGGAMAVGGLVAPGVVTGLGGPLVNGVFGGMLWKLHRSASGELTSLSSDIRRFRDTAFAVWITGQIGDAKARDEALAKLAEGIERRGGDAG